MQYRDTLHQIRTTRGKILGAYKYKVYANMQKTCSRIIRTLRMKERVEMNKARLILYCTLNPRYTCVNISGQGRRAYAVLEIM